MSRFVNLDAIRYRIRVGNKSVLVENPFEIHRLVLDLLDGRTELSAEPIPVKDIRITVELVETEGFVANSGYQTGRAGIVFVQTRCSCGSERCYQR
jgi:hypothetical protein